MKSRQRRYLADRLVYEKQAILPQIKTLETNNTHTEEKTMDRGLEPHLFFEAKETQPHEQSSPDIKAVTSDHTLEVRVEM